MRKNFSIPELEAMALQIRRNVVTFLMHSRINYCGGALSSVELATTLFFNELNFNPAEPDWKHRDIFLHSMERFFPVSFSALAEAGFFPKKKILDLSGKLCGYGSLPVRESIPGIELMSYSSGQDISIAVGASLGFRLSDAMFRKVFCLTSDAEHQDGQIWEGVAAASFYKLDNICAVIDCCNFISENGNPGIMTIDSLAEKYRAFNWNVVEISGHEIGEILNAFEQSHKIKDKPTAIIAKTSTGRGISFMEDKKEWFLRNLTGQEGDQALKDLGTNYETMSEYLLNE